MQLLIIIIIIIIYRSSIQGAAFKLINEAISKKDISVWSNTINEGASLLHNFARKALLQVLPTASNLVRWKRSNDPTCPLCKSGAPQTNKHVVSNCPAPAALERYTTRHNDVLRLLINWLKSVITEKQKLFVDLPNTHFQSTSELFLHSRPDIALMDSASIKSLELTVCHETNLIASKQYKVNKYSNLANSCTALAANKLVTNFTIEVSTLGFISQISDFLLSAKLPMLPAALKQDIIHSVLNNTFKIYCNRNSPVAN